LATTGHQHSELATTQTTPMSDGAKSLQIEVHLQSIPITLLAMYIFTNRGLDVGACVRVRVLVPITKQVAELYFTSFRASSLPGLYISNKRRSSSSYFYHQSHRLSTADSPPLLFFVRLETRRRIRTAAPSKTRSRRLCW
jgi:hypothetical protein